MSFIKRIWLHLKSSLWFVPTLLVAGAGVLATAMLEIDLRTDADLADKFPRLFGAGADGSRDLLADETLSGLRRATTFEKHLGKAFDQIRESASGNTAVLGARAAVQRGRLSWTLALHDCCA